MSYQCQSCNKTFKVKQSYDRHLLTNSHIKRQDENRRVYACPCGKSYLYRQSLYSHKLECPNESQSSVLESVSLMREKLILYEKEHEEMKAQIVKEREEMKAQIAMLLEKHATPLVQTTTNNNNNNKIDNQTNNNNITININAFGNETTDYIDDKAILACIGRVYRSIPSLLEKIHFDPKHPENHNIKITNKKLPYASVMGNNQKWKTVDRKDAIDTMVLNSYNLLDEKYKENKDKISESKQQHFKGFQTKFETEDKELMKEIKFEVDMMVLNGVQP
jgi:hypothetical protein